jgi:hypothetical protein
MCETLIFNSTLTWLITQKNFHVNIYVFSTKSVKVASMSLSEVLKLLVCHCQFHSHRASQIIDFACHIVPCIYAYGFS